MQEIVKLRQNIDTLKYHLYPSNLITSADITNYNLLIDNLSSIKMNAQIQKNENKSFKQYQYSFNGDSFQIMPATVRGFSVSIKNHDVTIHLKRIVLSADQSPFSKVEFRAHFLQRYGYLGAIQKVNKFLKDHIIATYAIKISEIHLHCDVQGHNLSILDFHKLKTKSNLGKFYDNDGMAVDSCYYSGRSFSGFYKGTGDYMLRVYDKTKEIKKFPDKRYIESLWKTNKDYIPTQKVIRIEFQLRREKLKNMVINGTVLDGFEVILNNLNNLWGRCLEDFSLRDISNKHATEILLGFKTLKNGEEKLITIDAIRQRFTRSNLHPLWEAIQTFNGHYQTNKIDTFVKPFTKDFIYVHNAFKAFLSTTLSHYGDIRPAIIEEAMKKVEEYTFDKHERTVIQDVYSKRLDRFNKLEIKNPDDEDLYMNKHHFVNRVFDHIEQSYDGMYHWDVAYDCNEFFIKKFQKFLGEAV